MGIQIQNEQKSLRLFNVLLSVFHISFYSFFIYSIFYFLCLIHKLQYKNTKIPYMLKPINLCSFVKQIWVGIMQTGFEAVDHNLLDILNKQY